jgi:transcriptional regulator with XRE-family HTH domain
MTETLESCIRTRAQALGISSSEMCRRAKLSRQTLHNLTSGNSGKLPSLQTIVALARVLHIHPMRLLQLVFDEHPSSAATRLHDPCRSADQSAFVRDVSFADGDLVLPGQRFTKIWELQNVGSATWQDRFMQCQDEDLVVLTRDGRVVPVTENLRPNASLVAVPPTEPGQTVQISIEFTAPQIPGTFMSYWKSVFADGTLCFPQAQGLSVKVRVSTLATASQEMR